MSTARGGESSASEPGLEHLIGALTASGHPHELAGRDAALAAFQAASQRPAPAGRARSVLGRSVLGRSVLGRSAWRRSAWRRRPIHVALPARLAVTVAAIVAVLGGFTAAATAQALPAPVQQLAYNVLAPLGVPVSQPVPSHHGQSASPRHPSPATGPASSQGGCPCPTASASASGTGAGTHPHRARKPKAKPKVPVAKPLLSLVSHPLRDRLIVVAHSGRPGDIVKFMELTGGAWTLVASEPLGPKLRAALVLPVRTAAGHDFKAEVLEGAPHGAVASNRLWIPRPAKTGAKAIQPSPTTSPTGTGSPAPTPTPTPTTTLTSTTAPASGPGPTASPSPTASPTSSPDPTGSPDPTNSPDPTTSTDPTTAPDPTTSGTGSAVPTSAPDPFASKTSASDPSASDPSASDPSASATAPASSSPPQTPEPRSGRPAKGDTPHHHRTFIVFT